MKFSSIILPVIVFSHLLACTSGSDFPSPRKATEVQNEYKSDELKANKIKREIDEDEASLDVSEPIGVSGGFLFCQSMEANDTACRIDNDKMTNIEPDPRFDIKFFTGTRTEISVETIESGEFRWQFDRSQILNNSIKAEFRYEGKLIQTLETAHYALTGNATYFVGVENFEANTDCYEGNTELVNDFVLDTIIEIREKANYLVSFEDFCGIDRNDGSRLSIERNGETVLEVPFEISEGISDLEVDLGNLLPGTYELKISPGATFGIGPEDFYFKSFSIRGK